MLQHLSVKNYALIDKLELELPRSFSVITGETGAGKSIILGALGLILGKRADLKSLRNPQKKCIVEGSFLLNANRYAAYFEQNDLDFETPCLLRREISPSGKSRAFINDTPVNLKLLNELAAQIIDVHSQHDTLLLNDDSFQLQLLDSYADNEQERTNYRQHYQAYKAAKKELKNFEESADLEGKDIDYLEFLFKELEEAKLEPEEQERIEEELRVLENSEEITSHLGAALQAIENDIGQGISPELRSLLQSLRQLSSFQENYKQLAERVDSLNIELDDIRQELEDRSQQLEHDPNRLESLDSRLSLLIHLQKKHGVSSDQELIDKREELSDKLNSLANFEERKAALLKALEQSKEQLLKAADDLSKSRKKVVPTVEDKINNILHELKMPDAQFLIDLQPGKELSAVGSDAIAFAFSANAGQRPQPLKKIASGGEMSRVMLALKAIMAEKNDLPSIIFDEIDSGVSGETAGKIGQILSRMGIKMQVLAITHLPQIASKGGAHFQVLKRTAEGTTSTEILRLADEERLHELARLLSGEKITDAALANARNLLAHA